MIQGIQLDSIGDKITFNACFKSKIKCKPLPKDSGKRAKKLGEKVYSNVRGPSRHLTTDKKLYYVSFNDDNSRELVIYLMSWKDQVFLKYKLYKAMMLRQQNICVKLSSQTEGASIQARNLKIIYLGKVLSIS